VHHLLSISAEVTGPHKINNSCSLLSSCLTPQGCQRLCNRICRHLNHPAARVVFSRGEQNPVRSTDRDGTACATSQQRHARVLRAHGVRARCKRTSPRATASQSMSSSPKVKWRAERRPGYISSNVSSAGGGLRLLVKSERLAEHPVALERALRRPRPAVALGFEAGALGLPGRALRLRLRLRCACAVRAPRGVPPLLRAPGVEASR
jgi:hypothetical protein